MKRDDLTGSRFGRLTVERLSHKDKYGTLMWECLCDCGNVVTTQSGSLRTGKTQSCGCLQRERSTTHGMTKTRTFKSWESMKGRCLNPNDASYARYGAKGITVCQRWKDSFDLFLADMGERPEGKTLDRYPDRNGNYEPGNCRWADARDQVRNMRSSRTLTIQGTTMPLIEWAPILGLTYSTLLRRVSADWPVGRIIREPARKKRMKKS